MGVCGAVCLCLQVVVAVPMAVGYIAFTVAVERGLRQMLGQPATTARASEPVRMEERHGGSTAVPSVWVEATAEIDLRVRADVGRVFTK